MDKWYGDFKSFEEFLTKEIGYNAINDYPWDEDKEYINPDYLPESWNDFPIIKAAKKWKGYIISKKETKDKLKRGIL